MYDILHTIYYILYIIYPILYTIIIDVAFLIKNWSMEGSKIIILMSQIGPFLMDFPRKNLHF